MTHVSLFMLTLIVSVLSLVAAVIAVVAVPMAGLESAIIVPFASAILTVPIALAFSHGPHAADAAQH